MKMIKRSVAWFIAMLILIFLISFLLPSKYVIEKEIKIAGTKPGVFLLASDLRFWNLWVVWSRKYDSTAVIRTQGEPATIGSSLTWNGKVINEGMVKITGLVDVRELTYEMVYGDNLFIFNGFINMIEIGDSIRVIWKQEGETAANPIAKYMGLMIQRMMKRAMETGLQNLKHIVESRNGWPYVEEVTWPAQNVIYIEDSTRPEEYGKVLKQAQTELFSHIFDLRREITGHSFTTFTRWDSARMCAVIEIGVPVEKMETGGVNYGRIRQKSIPSQKVIQLHYFGTYALTADYYKYLDQYLRDAGLDPHGGPWEIYVTDPGEEKDTARWETILAYPVR